MRSFASDRSKNLGRGIRAFFGRPHKRARQGGEKNARALRGRMFRCSAERAFDGKDVSVAVRCLKSTVRSAELTRELPASGKGHAPGVNLRRERAEQNCDFRAGSCRDLPRNAPRQVRRHHLREVPPGASSLQATRSSTVTTGSPCSAPKRRISGRRAMVPSGLVSSQSTP